MNLFAFDFVRTGRSLANLQYSLSLRVGDNPHDFYEDGALIADHIVQTKHT